LYIFDTIHKTMRRNAAQNRQPRRRNRQRPASAKVTQQDATRQTTRTLNRITNVNLSAISPNGGTVAYATLLNPLSAFAGSSTLIQQYEQFRISRIRVYARTDCANMLALNPLGRLLATYSLAEYSTIASFVDYDSFAAPTEQSFLGRDAMKIRSIRPGNFTLVASYAPRCRLSDATNSLPALVPHATTTWISTDYSDLDWLGLNLRCTQDSPLWGTATNDCAKVQLFVKADVMFRGLKKDQTFAVALPTLDPTILTLTSYAPAIKYSGDIPSDDEESARDGT